jgi:hypothetical protein
MLQELKAWLRYIGEVLMAVSMLAVVFQYARKAVRSWRAAFKNTGKAPVVVLTITELLLWLLVWVLVLAIVWLGGNLGV